MRTQYVLYDDNWKNIPYWQHLCNEFYTVCHGKHVIELAPHGGWQTRAILSCSPLSVTAVEANPLCLANITKNAPEANIIIDDVYHWYHEDHPADVVTCCGLLYHLHSPLYLLELIVNKSDPEYIILDNCSQYRGDTVKYEYEDVGSVGSKYSKQLPKLVKLNCSLPLTRLDLAMADLGYEQLVIDLDIQRFNMESKPGYMVTYRKSDTIQRNANGQS